MIDLKVEGLEDVRLRLINLPIHLRKKVMYTLLRKAAKPIVRAAKANAPVAKQSSARVIPGLIKKTVGVTRSKFKKPAAGEFGVFVQPRVPGKIKSLKRRATRGGGKGPNFGDPFYFKFQEFGFHATGGKKVGGGRRNRKANLKASGSRFIPGLQFLGRAFESQKSAALNLINSDLVKAITDQFNKRAK